MMKEERSAFYPNGCSWVRGPLLGKGGFGSVFLALLKTPSLCMRNCPPLMAVKSTQLSVAKELARERKVLEALDGSPFIIRCYGEDFNRDEDGTLVANLFLEYASGGSLASLIQKSTPNQTEGFGFGLAEPQVRLYTESILRGIQHIHEAGYVHCDLKPENILLVPQATSNGSSFATKIADFGLAKEARGSKCRVRGTQMYLSPESVVYGVQEQPSDIWALGCVVLSMLTGKQPWDWKPEQGEKKLKQLIVKEVPVIPTGISKEAKDFLNKCFATNPTDRPTAEILLSHPFVSLRFLKIRDEQLCVQAEESLSHEPIHYEFGDSFIPLCSSSFDSKEADEMAYGDIRPALSKIMWPRPSPAFAIQDAA
ncbi:hypothetical protein FNV43_RR18898 [Rhamnella rubrinervis]|uniref:Protein kinase domain-containing protein n=1 Tax=Rhamnella rubrinervis TaxID=2594499 RepID=A0A8K0E754_9ROSA|nr:hypothetical protein FNV43_RR18898 [Rhamnella rubrinervis]